MSALVLLAISTITVVSGQQLKAQGHGGLLVTVLDSAGRSLDDARLFITPGNKLGRTGEVGRFLFSNLRAGSYRVQINRLGYIPTTMTVAVPDSGIGITARLERAAQQLEPVLVSERKAQLPRVYERQQKHLGHVLFSEDLPRYQAFSVSDLLVRVPEFSALLSATRTCRSLTVFVDGLNVPPEWELDEYVKPAEIAAIEVHQSADFIREDFLKSAPDPPTPPPTQTIGPIRLGTRPPKVSQSLSGTCGRIVMIWTWWYHKRR